MFPGRSISYGHTVNIVGVDVFGPGIESIYVQYWYPTACPHILLYRKPSVGKVTDEQPTLILLLHSCSGEVITLSPVGH